MIEKEIGEKKNISVTTVTVNGTGHTKVLFSIGDKRSGHPDGRG
jgi:bifunctional N-acetylglucosamine-1-phosphate-uridyltransferase/glucosamine-1-phosphate-acetyltransferase GlmU-like protein